MDTIASIEEQNAVFRAEARYSEQVEPTWRKVAGRTPDEYERLYLAAWGRVCQKYPFYLYPDDRLEQEFFVGRSEDVSAISYENIVGEVRQARADTLHWLTTQAEAALANATGNDARSILADLLKNAAKFVRGYTVPDSKKPGETEDEREQRVIKQRPLFETMRHVRFTPRLPDSGLPAHYSVDEPKRVGGALAALQHFLHLREQFLAAEIPLTAGAAPPQATGIFRPGFSDEDADWVASELELIDSAGNYSGLPGVAASRLCGFYWRLKEDGIVKGSLEKIRDYFAMRYLKHPITTKPSMTTVAANEMAADAKEVIKRLKAAKN